MAANFYFVFVKNKEEVDIQQFLSNIDFEGFVPVKEVDIWNTSKPDTLYIGKHEEYLIFAEQSIPLEFYKEKPGLIEQKFIEFFPNSEIAAFVLNESVGMFGYAIIENGNRRRIKLGSDGEIHLEIGEKLPRELNIVIEDIFSEDEIEEWRENGENMDATIDFEASYRVTGRLISERLGKDFYTLKDNDVTLFRYE